jgi:sarcosine oxidase delta subunit
MEPIKVTLCEHCSECPEVEITDQGESIGEDENIVRLSHAEWNELVRLQNVATPKKLTRNFAV